ncbi:MAG TPA: NAD(P)H-binding protein [Polyangia bacterium]|nr:NAD(P)H-binding protein [Polyangia bacterium]
MGDESTAPILVTGGTGTLGRQVVAQLREAGRKVRILSRRGREAQAAAGAGVEVVSGDLGTGQGVEAALAGTEVVLHCAGSSRGDDEKARQLVRAGARAGTRHLVFISVVGADAVPVAGAIDRAMFGYFESKLAAERVIAGSGLPWTTLRATQFHDLVMLVARQMARLPVVPLPIGFRFQPIAAGEVAARLVELASGEPSGLVPAMGGPRVYGMGDLLRSTLRATGRHRLTFPVWLPGEAARAVRAGAILAPDRAVGRLTWEEFLAARVGPPSDTTSGAMLRAARSTVG